MNEGKMLNDSMKKEYYQALLEKNTKYEGVFFVGVTTTGVFCRPSCPARKPKFENREFFSTAQEALVNAALHFRIPIRLPS
jgi:AraC family transcriptional regulator of adaptative response/methylated-DNA-[protein]-cysteine methyltransferase